MHETNLTYKGIFKFIYPSILLMVFMSIYIAIDGVFIARFVSPIALGGQSIVMPLYTVATAVGIMLATGGSAIIAMQLGQKDTATANINFTTLMIVGTAFGIIATIVCLILKDPILIMLGLEGNLWSYGLDYSFYIIISFPFLIIKVLYETLLRVDGSPRMALYMTVLGGVLNLIFDYIFMVPFKMGIAGAGLGTFLGIALSNVLGFYHFFSKKSVLKFQFHRPTPKFLLRTLTNGSSEMVNELAIALMTFMFNMLALKYIGEIGVSAVTIIMAINFMVASLHIGFSMGIATLISYNHGAKNTQNIAKILDFSKYFLILSSLISCLIVLFFAKPLVSIYAAQSTAIFPIAIRGLRLVAIGFLYYGLNIFGSAFFTAFGNGKISALISFIKSFVIFIIVALTLPNLMKADGIWLITPITELLAICMVIFFMKKYQQKYHYDIRDLFGFKNKRKV